MGQCLEAGGLHLPELARLPSSNVVLPFAFLGDEAFQLRPDFLRPYPGRGLTDERRIFNYRLSRAR